MIQVHSLCKHFGGLKAVHQATLNIQRGKITGLIGPNGAGKTTLFNTIAGVYAPTGGRILLDGEDVTGFAPHQLFAKGLVRTFQIAHEFPTLTVLENLMMVPPAQLGERLVNTWLRRRRMHKQEAQLRRQAEAVLEFLKLSPLADELAGNLSGGQKKLLELGRTMMTDAKVVLLDEVGAGVNRTLLNDIGDAILRLNRERNYTFCMIEHDMEMISRLCDPVIVMAEGAVLTEGSAAEVNANEQVIEAYLGRGLGIKRRHTARVPIPQPRPQPTRSDASAAADLSEVADMRFFIGEAMTGGYGGADILDACTVGVSKGEIVVIVGPNGAGKSTAMKAMLGMLKLRHGRIMLGGVDISGLAPQARVARGIAFVPQVANVFVTMSVQENLEMGAYLRRDDFTATMEQVFELFPVLREKRRQLAGELSGGQRQQVAVARALMTKPSVLMLDEPTAGVSPLVMDDLFARILEVRDSGVAILMVEQNARQALSIADRGYVLVLGANRHTDRGAALLANPEVRKSFLGG